MKSTVCMYSNILKKRWPNKERDVLGRLYLYLGPIACILRVGPRFFSMGERHWQIQSELKGWFRQYSTMPTYEIEARIYEVSPAGFNHVVTRLLRNPQWSNAPAWRETLDRMHASGVRETVDMVTKERSFIKKHRLKHFTTPLTAANTTHEVRDSFLSFFSFVANGRGE